MKTKTCSKCSLKKPLSEYHLQNGKPRSACKLCRKTESQEYNARAYVKQKAKEEYQKNKESIRNRLKANYGTLNGRYHQYKGRAQRSGLTFELTQEDCLSYYKVPCAYCGSELAHLSIDRIDNTKGYTKDNYSPCCSICNYMKFTLSLDEFKTQVLKIAKFIRQENGKENSDGAV